jgi:hypothetical protein
VANEGRGWRGTDHGSRVSGVVEPCTRLGEPAVAANEHAWDGHRDSDGIAEKGCWSFRPSEVERVHESRIGIGRWMSGAGIWHPHTCE